MTEPNAQKRALRVLVVDDEKNILTTLSVCLEGMGCVVNAVASKSAALSALMRHPFDLAFVDLRLKEGSGLDLLPELLKESPELAVVIITAYGNVDTVVEAIKRGATDYLPKPFTPAQIRHVVEQATDRRAMRRRVAELEEKLAESVPETDLSTESPKMRAVLDIITRVAASDISVLVRGESGTGKGVLARALHAQSSRVGQPFVMVNCPTLSEELLASELFGHARGAFTGAVRDQPGRVEIAQGGTLFLDEVSEIAPGLQAKLLRFLQEKEFERVGENQTRRADVRVVAATNRELEQEVQRGRFREDLLFRLNVVEITIPPLRERPEDILPLARRFLSFFARAARRPLPEFSKEAEAVLISYPWPGNIRELRNAIERAIILWPARVIEKAALPERIVVHSSAGPSLGGNFSLEEIEREHIQRVLSRAKTQEEAATILGIDASTLWRKRRRYEG
jgi:NtrC-family two-component system response regulator AlgB